MEQVRHTRAQINKQHAADQSKPGRRSLMLNHWYHHRGQLSVYLRLLDVSIPSIYGPSADENPFAAALAPAN